MSYFKERILSKSQFLFRVWYRIVSLLDRKGHVQFMNYGFSGEGEKIDLHPEEEHNRFSIQLYHHVAEDVTLAGKKVLEVGSGRGGGLAFLSKVKGPFHGIGVDMDKRAVKFCNKKHGGNGLEFIQGDAQNLPFEDNSTDLILNVESSHRYPRFDQFLEEVHRILKPGGSFLFTDFRYHFQVADFQASLERSKLIKQKEVNITDRVLEALELDDPRKRKLISNISFWPINKIALDFAGVVGSHTYNSFESKRWLYYSFHFTKPLSD